MNIEEKEFLIQEAGKNQFLLLLVTEILNEVSHSLVCENSNEKLNVL